MDRRTPLPTFGGAPAEYSQEYANDIARALNQLVSLVKNPGEGRQSSMVLTNLNTSGSNTENGTLYNENGFVRTSGTGNFGKGQLLIGNGDGSTNIANLTAGTNIVIQNGQGSIVISSPDAVFGPSSSVLGTVAVFNGTDGHLIKDTGVSIDDMNNVANIAVLTITGTLNAPSITEKGSGFDLNLLIGNSFRIKSNGNEVFRIGPLGQLGLSGIDYGTAGYPLVSGGNSSPAVWAILSALAGGTGHNTYSDGQLLIGNSSTNSLSRTTLTVADGVSMTVGAGSILLNNSLPGFSRVQVYTSGVNQWTIPDGVSRCKVTVVGGGGNGGTATVGQGASGGGGGGTSIKYIPGLSSGNSITATVGAATVTSSFGSYCSATGGTSGTGAVTYVAGGLGGTGSDGDINIKGQGGGSGYGTYTFTDGGAQSNTIPFYTSGMGGSSAYGGGGASSIVNTPAINGGNYGGGGGGGASSSGTRSGGTGAGGIVIIEY